MDSLSPIMQKFILHWGEMGSRWGINRTVAQVHALLYASPTPLNADDIVGMLGVARSNVSNSLHELQGWGIVKVVHVMGDRRDHFESLQDVWQLFQCIMHERKRREFDPTIALLRQCIAEAEKAGAAEAHLKQRLQALAGFFETMSTWYDHMRGLPTTVLMEVLRFGGKMRKLVGLSK
jgi:DNA-binding transcriptional regulator GbsR (MarR family)